jgi:hypothetical protein
MIARAHVMEQEDGQGTKREVRYRVEFRFAVSIWTGTRWSRHQKEECVSASTVDGGVYDEWSCCETSRIKVDGRD